MSSQFKILNETWGALKIFAIYARDDGTWEKNWEPLRAEEEIADLISPISYWTYQDLRIRNAQPFLQEVGLGPEGCLIKLGEERGTCYYREECPSYDATLCGANLDPPSCYDANIEPLETRALLTRLVDLWRLGFYVILVEPETV